MPIMSYENILITVGTTEFDSLINKIIYGKEALGILKNLNCKNLLCQLGTGNPLVNIDIPGINIISFSLKAEGLQNDIQWADLIISHAGAGTCMDVLSAKKPLIVVVNEELMHNHQLELAEQLSNDGYLLYTTLQNFPETLRNINITTLKEYKQGNIDTFLLHLNTFMGF